ncbi:MAG: ABC transporter ATP-binding protein, partial [Phycisphaerales bacterium]
PPHARPLVSQQNTTLRFSTRTRYNPPMHAVVTNRLRKSYGHHEALRGIDLRVPAGSLYGFLGPNGAGKTTTLRILMGLLRASGGSATVLDQDCWRDGARLRRDVGYLPGDIRLYGNMTGRSTLAFFDSARGTQSRDQINRLAKVLDLDLAKRVRDYSRGMKQKLGLIQALMHRPELLILDEPTTGLDPLMQTTLHEELRHAADEGRTVLFSSHSLGEVEQLCNMVGILREGLLIEQAKIETLRARAIRRVEIVFTESGKAHTLPKGLHVLQEHDRRLEGSWVGPVQDLLKWLVETSVREVMITPPDLEDLFLAYYANGTPGTAEESS